MSANSSSEDFDRIRRLPPYVFAEVNRLKAEFRAEGKDIIDFGMGNPDLPTPPHIVEKMIETARNPITHGYSMSKGIPGLRKAICGYYDRRFGVELNPETEAIVTIGSKEGLANMAQAITKPGDTILVPNPSYPIHCFGFVIAGASVYHLPKYQGRSLKDQVEEAVKKCSPKPTALILNYPCNPTAEIVDLAFYEEMVDLCKFHGIYILSDLAYCEIYFDDMPPPSVLQVKGAKDIAVEFTTMSKTYSMPGWRIGFAVGNQKLIHALTRIKSYLDYGAFTPIQVAAAAALNGPQDCVEETRQIYKERRDILISGMKNAGWDIEEPKASMFAWAKLPEKYLHLGSLEFSKLLMEKADVAVAPGIGFGEYGDEYVRIALVENKQRIRQACRNVKRFLNND
ncbi:MAG: aminotransferase [Alphaproteobacteria bacterium CG11_big_fil_rev_8_21_14_0_20_44_7]|nr:MAG: aminotransferase [Alphaproteobacteria bacterium CG11_big_fil_rev_8_21_14_0_20_44_7]